jgi:hypothetical protein
MVLMSVGLLALLTTAEPKLKVIKAEVSKVPVTQALLDTPDDGVGDCDCGAWKLTASSILKSDAKASYEEKQARDNKLKTAWCEGVPGFGEGQSVTIETDSDLGHPTWQGEVTLLNGYQVSEGVRKKNGRIKTLKASLNGTPIALVLLADAPGWQSFSLYEALPKGANTRGAKMKLEIVDVYSEGATSQDTCITELNINQCCP